MTIMFEAVDNGARLIAAGSVVISLITLMLVVFGWPAHRRDREEDE